MISLIEEKQGELRMKLALTAEGVGPEVSIFVSTVRYSSQWFWTHAGRSTSSKKVLTKIRPGNSTKKTSKLMYYTPIQYSRLFTF
jgi:hypothetical protein